jgi:uncharacterized membrane protein YadS
MIESGNRANDDDANRSSPYRSPAQLADAALPAETAATAGRVSEDVWAIVLGVTVLSLAIVAATFWGEALAGWFAQPGSWIDDPRESLIGKAVRPAWFGSLIAVAVIGSLAIGALGNRRAAAQSGGQLQVVGGFLMVAALATAAFVMAGQQVLRQYGLEYVLWALLLGLMIRNTVGLPRWLSGAVRGELFIKWGLVLLGAEVLLGKLLALGLPGIMVSWVVTPIVLIVTFWFGRRILKISSPSLVIVVAADMSVCGVSAAIATAAACRAKKEELSLAIGMSLAFTAVMMVAMPLALRFAEVDPIVAGAWIGGTIDSTGAVAAAGAALQDEAQGDRAMKVAVTVKMIQNVLIGVIAFAVSVFWAARYETPEAVVGSPSGGSFLAEVWRRFPKFVLGFLAASLVASAIAWSGSTGEALITTTVDLITKQLRNWLFCLAFVCIGLELHVRTLLPALSGGKTLVLYVVGQSFNILLTGLMASLVFGWLFRDAIRVWLP